MRGQSTISDERGVAIVMKNLLSCRPLVASVLVATAWFTAGFQRTSSVSAMPSIQTAFVKQYPWTKETGLNNCATCHMPAKQDFLNGYGLALRAARLDFARIEALDSDGDGRSNTQEIREGTNPGSHAQYPEYFIFHVNFDPKKPEVGSVHFNHEWHVVKDSFLSKGRCANCHEKNLFPREFNDEVSVRPIAHQLCWRCHETSGSKVAPTDCKGCHTGIEGNEEQLKARLK
jgi:mono/diheme cytochrome c family protein